MFFPVVGFDDAVADGLLEKVNGVLVVDCGAGVAAGIEEAFGVCLVGHDGRGRVDSGVEDCCWSICPKLCHILGFAVGC